MSRQNKKKGRAKLENDSDNESINDVASVYSSGSLDVENFEEDSQINLPTEKYEEKVMQLIENATEKSAKTRVQAIQSLCEILQHRYFPEFIETRKLTITDIAEKSLRRGKDSEQKVAARLVLLLIVQIGGNEDNFKGFPQLFLTSLQNTTSSCLVRMQACISLAIFYFLIGDDISDIVGAMQQLEQVFAGSYSKGSKSLNTVSDDMAQLHAESLRGWGLLATLIPPREFCSLIKNCSIITSTDCLIGLLNSSHVEIRMACGEVIAVIFEHGRMFDEIFLENHLPNLINLTCVLSKDSQKYRGKKERKAQRASFRDVHRYLDDDILPDIRIRFGKEILEINTWSSNIQYQKLCDIIGPGITTHLIENEFIRDIFQLGSKAVHPSVCKNSKLQRHLMNAAAFKARTVNMKKNRDKRSIVFS